jgi:hypothetical protein
MRYALLLCIEENVEMSPDAASARTAAYGAFADEMLARGILRDRGLRLQPTATATTVQVRHGDVVIADGPFAETKEQIAGLYIIECADLDEAIEVAAKSPTVQHGTIEVRPVWEM